MMLITLLSVYAILCKHHKTLRRMDFLFFRGLGLRYSEHLFLFFFLIFKKLFPYNSEEHRCLCFVLVHTRPSCGLSVDCPGKYITSGVTNCTTQKSDIMVQHSVCESLLQKLATLYSSKYIFSYPFLLSLTHNIP